ncbi:hypothetical protein H2199_007152 [Coniosporium tulheliwenetii]|uniref:Uncharacterized protein n=1 Tax=Coniosporium tulheliwenetii TaxID=3383036 RepID=A0ACC2YQJ9_9PEZI|nr:hypothetical protein H2199_007152 [Cladosporium sp. JES 115]
MPTSTPSVHSTLRKHSQDRIVDEMAQARKDDTLRAFICCADVERIWSESAKIATVMYPKVWDQPRLKRVQSDMILILSILVYIGAQDSFLKLFHPETGEPLSVDSDLPLEDEQLDFLDSPGHRQTFDERQFWFIPETVHETFSQKTQVIKDVRRRLPFEYREENVGMGGYGEVSLICIPPGYIKHEERGGSDQELLVACKKIVPSKDFSKEVDNLQILKESITSHSRIMLHQATIKHGLNHYILFPYAEFGDLEVFFHCGYTSDGFQRYLWPQEFKEFAEISDANITKRVLLLLSECFALADAIAWLHNGITVENTSTRMFCAHMDLKPANVLIKKWKDGRCGVGRWMISDFGISAFKEDTEKQDSRFVSIRDWYSEVTLNTRPKRYEGTYQAPEVQDPETFPGASSSSPANRKGIGRKSDIWSYGCILSEVLAFALGKDELVTQFQRARKGPMPDDYFYSKKGSQYITTAARPKQYEIRPSVSQWLDGLSGEFTNPGKWIACYVGTIKKILNVDAVCRPDANLTKELVGHVKDHIEACLSDNIRCDILHPKQLSEPTPVQDEKPPVTPDPPHTPSTSELRVALQGRTGSALSGGTPTIIRSSTLDEEILSGGLSTVDEGSTLPTSPDTSSPSTARDTISTTFSGKILAHQLPEPDPRHSISIYRKPLDAYGIMSKADLPRVPQESTLRTLTTETGRKLKAKDVALSHTGDVIAYLAESLIYIFDIDLAGKQATLRAELGLRPLKGWKNVAVSGSYLAAWGHEEKRNKLVSAPV